MGHDSPDGIIEPIDYEDDTLCFEEDEAMEDKVVRVGLI